MGQRDAQFQFIDQGVINLNQLQGPGYCWGRAKRAKSLSRALISLAFRNQRMRVVGPKPSQHSSVRRSWEVFPSTIYRDLPVKRSYRPFFSSQIELPYLPSNVDFPGLRESRTIARLCKFFKQNEKQGRNNGTTYRYEALRSADNGFLRCRVL
jgi:hypothetical protein